MRKWCGCEVETGWGAPECADVFSAKVGGPARFDGRDLSVPCDISSAAFLLVAAALLPGSDLTVEGVGLNPTRAEIIPTLRWLGADVRVVESRERCNEPVGDVRARGAESGFVPDAADEDATRGIANVLRG